MTTEPERIRRYYLERLATDEGQRYSLFRRAHLYTVQSIERDLLSLLVEVGLTELGDRRILDVGCGDGSWIHRLVLYGATPANIVGVDLLPEHIGVASALVPGSGLLCANAERLPLASEAFDVILQFVTLSSILDKQARRRAAREMLRVLKPGGTIVCYDFIFNPLNRQTRGLPQRDYHRLFPGCSLHFHRVTLAPPITRYAERLSWILCEMLEKIVFFRSHYLVVITKMP